MNGMKRVMMAFLGLLVTLPGRSQSFAEWFEQNSTRLKYYAQQIAALQVYYNQLEKGYSICNVGLEVIGGSKQGEYDLHNGYYASMGQINSVLRQLGEVAEITGLQVAIIHRFTDALARYRGSGLLGPERLAYIGHVYSNVLQAGLADVGVLTEVLTSGDWQMTDDQRMGRIRELDAAMRDRYEFTLSFMDRTDLLEGQLAGEQAGVGTVKALYGIP